MAKRNLVLGTISVLVVFATAIVAVSCITQAVYAFVCREIIDAIKRTWSIEVIIVM